MNLYFKSKDRDLYFCMGKKLRDLRLTIQKCDNIIGPAVGNVIDYAPLSQMSEEIRDLTNILFKDSFVEKKDYKIQLNE